MSIYDDPTYAEFLKSYAPAPEPTAAKPKGRTGGEVASDAFFSLAGGGASLAKGVLASTIGNQNDIYNYFDRSSQIAAESMSEQSKLQKAELAEKLQSGGLTDAARYALTTPSLMGNMIIESLPAMGAGGGVGGLLARGVGATGAVGTAIASGVGEGTFMATDVYDKTANATAALGALALGTVTGGLTPGNVLASATRKGLGEAVESTVPRVLGMELPGVAKAGVAGAVKRVGLAIGEEAGQEFVQEGGQALLEQYGKGEKLDLEQAAKQGFLGAALGGVMGGGMHPIVGEGSKAAELQNAEAVLAQDPTNPVAQAEVSLLRAQRDYVEAPADQRESLKPAVEVAHAAVVAARNPELRDAQDNLDTAKAEVVVNNAGMEGARAAADSVSIETKRAIEEAQTTDEALQAFADGQHAHSTLTVDAQSVANTRAGMNAVIPDVVNAALQEEIARASAPLASGTVNQEAFPVEGVPRVSDQIGLTRNTPQEVAQAQLTEAEATPLPTIDTEALAGEITSLKQANHPRVLAAEQAMAEAGYVPEVVRSMQEASTADLLRQHENIDTVPARTQMAEALLEARGTPVSPEARAARADLEAEVQTLAQAVERTPAAIRQLLQNVTQEQAQNNLNNSTLAQQHPVMRALAAVRGWDLSPEVEEITATELEEDLFVTQDMVDKLNDERLLGRDGTVEISDRLNDLVVDHAPDDVVEALVSVDHFRPADGVDTLVFSGDSADVLHWLQSEEGATVGGLRHVASLNRVRTILGLEPVGESGAEPEADQLEGLLQEAKAAEDVPVDVEAKIAELDRMAGDAMLTPAERRGARTQAANLRTEQAATAAANEVTPAPTGRAPATREGVRQVQRNFESRATAAKENGTLQKLGKFWRNLMSGRNAGQRTLPKVETSDLKTAMSAAVRAGLPLPQAALTQIKNRYNAKLRAMAEKWAAEHDVGVGPWVDPIISLAPQYAGRQAGFSMRLHGLGRGGNENPYAVRPSQATASFSADSTIHASSLQSAPGSADLAYRIAAEIGTLRGVPFPSDYTLTTVNPLRRQLQSLSADTLFGPGIINPMTSSGAQGPQGVPPAIWNRLTELEKIGLNTLRSAHSITETRANTATGGEWLENLEFDRQGRIVAVTDPKPVENLRTGVRAPFGFARGTVVTDQMLKDKIGEINPSTGYKTYEQESRGTGGIGVDTAKLGILNNTILNHIENNPDATIPAWIGTVARSTGRAMGGWFFSENEAVGPGITPAEAQQHLREVVGDKAAQVLLDTNLVRFVETPAELAELGGEPLTSVSGAVQGATLPDGSIVLVVGNLSGDTAAAVIQHEGLHATMKGLLGEDTYTRIMAQLDTMLKAGKGAPWVANARAAVPANTPAENVTEEVAAYALEQYVKNPESTNPLVAWARNFMSALRTAIIQNKALPEALRVWAIQNIQPQDLSRMAIAGLRQAAVTKGSMRESRRDFEGEIATLMEEHKGAAPDRRAAINAELNKLNKFRAASNDVRFEAEALVPSKGEIKLSVKQQTDRTVEAVAQSAAPAQELNILNNAARGAGRVLETLRSLIQDKHVTLRRVQQLAGITVENMQMDTMGALDRLGSKMASVQRRLVKEPLAAMENILQAAYTGEKKEERAYQDINTLLKMRHVAEYNRRMAELNPAKYDTNGKRVSGYSEAFPGSGINNEHAAAEIARLEASDHAPALLEAEGVYRQMIRDLQDYAVEQGIESADVVEAWRNPETGFPNYTPFNRELDLEENLGIGTAPGAHGFSLRSGISRRAMGSGAEIVDPLASTAILGMNIVRRGENAVVARTMFEFAKGFVPNYLARTGQLKPMWKVNRIPQMRVIKHVNIYKTLMVDGTMSPEFYNREQARLYADAQQALWVGQHPNEPVSNSGIRADLIDTADRVFIQDVPNVMNQDNIMVIPDGGENQIIEFDAGSEDAMAILNALKGGSTIGGGGGKVAKVMSQLFTPFRMFSRWTVAMATGYNPMFMPFNAIRDVGAAMINAKDGSVPGWTRGDSASIGKQFLSAYRGINERLKEEFKALHSNTGAAAEAAPDSWGWWMDQTERAGGMTGVIEHIAEPEEAKTMLRRLYGANIEDRLIPANEADDWLSKGQGMLLKAGDSFYRFGEGESKGAMEWASKNVAATIKRWNSASEAATRTIVFKMATEKYEQQGYSREDAMRLAAVVSKNISTNFNRRGNASTALNQLFPFFNAAVQGSTRLAEALFEKKTFDVTKDGHVMLDQKAKLSPFGKKVIASLASLGVAQAILLAAAGFDDDEPSQSTKDRAFIVPMGNGNFMAIPMPHGFNTMINVGRELTQATMAALGGEGGKVREHLSHATLGQLFAFNPLGGQDNWKLAISPALADPFMAIGVNEDIFGRQIAKEDMNPRNPTPGFVRTKEGGSATGRAIAEFLNDVSGGDADRPGSISPTGDQIDYLFGELGGGLTREAIKAGQTGIALAKDIAGVPREELPITRVPLVGRVFGQTTGAIGIRNRANEISTELNQLRNRYKGLMERANANPDAAEKAALKQEARDFKAANPEIALADDFNRFYTEHSQARKRRALARDNDEIEKVNAITETSTEKARKLLEKYDALKQ